MQRSVHYLSMGTAWQTPYYIFRGEEQGPCCFVTAGIHGKEIAGILATEEASQFQIDRGMLLMVPQVNRPAYLQRIRGIPDLNRTFPRQARQPARLLYRET